LAEILKIFSSETRRHNKLLLVGIMIRAVSEVKIFRNQPTETRITYGDHV
jgi:hypothetical protein